MSQRFSVLLPSLSTAPESSIRSLLASQRRTDGPSLTEEEEELLFAEIRNKAYAHGSSRLGDHGSFKGPDSLEDPANQLGVSSASPSTYSDGSEPITAPLDTPSTWPASPPPTSSSFASFRTFGVNDSNVKVKSYGFSGNAGFRDADYIRKMKRSASGKADVKSAWSDVPEDSEERPPSASVSATPTPSSRPAFASLKQPLISTPLSSTAAPSARSPTEKRVTLLAELTPAQVKRISLALGEIEGRLNKVSAKPVAEEQGKQDSLEYLHRDYTTHDRRSESELSEVSSAFQYRDSPAKPAADTIDAIATRLPPSPRSHNLSARVAPSEPLTPLPRPFFTTSSEYSVLADTPRPILTPSRTHPVRHNPSSSTSSISADHTPVFAYVPGQPRPIGSMHRSEGSSSSRAATPNTSPGPWRMSANRATFEDPDPGMIPSRSSSLGRSQSVNQSTRTLPPKLDASGPSHARAQSVDTKNSCQSALPHAYTPADIIEEERDDQVSDSSRFPEIKPVLGRFNVSDAQAIHRPVVNPGDWTIETPTSPKRVVSHQVTIETSDDSSDLHRHLQNTRNTLRQHASTNSMTSDYVDADMNARWDEVFASPRAIAYDTDADAQFMANQMLLQSSGMGWSELSILQARLVEKAKMERMVLRGQDGMSPINVSDSAIDADYCHPISIAFRPLLRSR